MTPLDSEKAIYKYFMHNYIILIKLHKNILQWNYQQKNVVNYIIVSGA